MGLYADIGLSAMLARERELKIVQNNIANMRTPGFESMMVIDAEYQVKEKQGDAITFVRDAGTIRNVDQGRFQSTGDPLHVYIAGRAWLSVQTPEGNRYTRSGIMTLNEQGELVTPQGYQVLNQSGGPIIFPEGTTDIIIAGDGNISTNTGQLDRLGLFSFKDEQALVDVHDNLVLASEEPIEAENYNIAQFGYEVSNGNEVYEGIRLMEILREFQQAQKLLEQESALQGRATETLLKISTIA